MEKLTEVELETISSTEPEPRSHRTAGRFCEVEEDISTPHGTVHVSIQGDRSKLPIMTYHDIGMNAESCFQGFFKFSEMQPILQHFCVYHITAPGQKTGAGSLTGSGEAAALMAKDTQTLTEYPSMDQLAEMLFPVCTHFGLKRITGFGVGAGANVLARFALMNPKLMDGLVLINCTAAQAGWVEWGYQKMNAWHLSGGTSGKGVEDYLLWHWFGYTTLATNHDLVQHYRQELQAVSPRNLGLFMQSYYQRTDLQIVRELDPFKKKDVRQFRCPVMLVAGTDSPHLDDTIDMNGRLDPEISTWMKMADCGGMALEEQPAKMAEAFLLFLQGLGHVPYLNRMKLRSAAHTLSPPDAPKPRAVTVTGRDPMC